MYIQHLFMIYLIKVKVVSYCTTDLDKLVKAASIVIILSVGFLIKLIRRGPARIVYFLPLKFAKTFQPLLGRVTFCLL